MNARTVGEIDAGLNRGAGNSERLERLIGRAYPIFNPVPSETQFQAFARVSDSRLTPLNE
jgi:hypothetical protein